MAISKLELNGAESALCLQMVGGGLGLTTESLDQLKVWLRSCLLDAYGWGSDCDSLMKYVVALVKKDRSAEDLRSDCLEQLKVRRIEVVFFYDIHWK